MTRDKLFLLRPDFEDPAYPGRRFYCWHCALMEGVIASFPHLLWRVDVERIAWPLPRREIIAIVGEENQYRPGARSGSRCADGNCSEFLPGNAVHCGQRWHTDCAEQSPRHS